MRNYKNKKMIYDPIRPVGQARCRRRVAVGDLGANGWLNHETLNSFLCGKWPAARRKEWKVNQGAPKWRTRIITSFLFLQKQKQKQTVNRQRTHNQDWSKLRE